MIRELNALMADGMIANYSITEKRDTNNRNDDIWYEELTLVFSNGKKLIVHSDVGRYLVERLTFEEG